MKKRRLSKFENLIESLAPLFEKFGKKIAEKVFPIYGRKSAFDSLIRNAIGGDIANMAPYYYMKAIYAMSREDYRRKNKHKCFIRTDDNKHICNRNKNHKGMHRTIKGSQWR